MHERPCHFMKKSKAVHAPLNGKGLDSGKPRRTKRKPKISPRGRPKLIRVDLAQIIPYSIDPIFSWMSQLSHLSLAVPALRQEAVSLLCICQPLVVTRVPLTQKDKPEATTFRLLSGYRTYQLLLEQKGGSKAQAWALELPDLALGDGIDFAVFDSLTSKLLLCPSHLDLALMGGVFLEDMELNAVLARQLAIGTNDQFAAQMGMSKSNFIRKTHPVREAIHQSRLEQKTADKVGLDIADETSGIQ